MKIVNFRLLTKQREQGSGKFFSVAELFEAQKELWADLVDDNNNLMCTAPMEGLSHIIKNKLVNE